jgi:putative ABC transport system permease protein
MHRHGLIAAVRSLRRNKVHAGLTIAGLAAAFAVAVVVGLFVEDQLSYDGAIPSAEAIYSLSTTFTQAGRAPMAVDTSPADLARALALDIPGIGEVARLNPDMVSLHHGAVEANEKVYWADPDIFRVLPLPAASGELGPALAQPGTVVLTRSMARKYFGRDDPVGETLELFRHIPVTVTAILQDLPAETNLAAEIFLSGATPLSGLSRLDAQPPGNSFLCTVHILFRLRPGAAIDQVRGELPAFLRRHRSLGDGDRAWLTATPLSQLHLRPSELSNTACIRTCVAKAVPWQGSPRWRC